MDYKKIKNDKNCEIIEKLEELERAEFMIHMIDHWTDKDREELHRIQTEIKELEVQLKELESL